MCDDEGNVYEAVAGPHIVASKEYDYTFTVDSWEIPESVDQYKVVDGELVHK